MANLEKRLKLLNKALTDSNYDVSSLSELYKKYDVDINFDKFNKMNKINKLDDSINDFISEIITTDTDTNHNSYSEMSYISELSDISEIPDLTNTNNSSDSSDSSDTSDSSDIIITHISLTESNKINNIPKNISSSDNEKKKFKFSI